MAWIGAGVPVLGSGLILSGTTTITLKASTYTVEYPIPGMERSPTEYLGKPQTRIEIDGEDWRSGAMARLAILSGYSHTFNQLAIPSTEPNQYFFNAGVYIEKLDYFFVQGYAYPFYKWRLSAVLSGGFNVMYGAFDPVSFDNAQSGYAYDTVWSGV